MKKLLLACQGGGSHTAFTAGVLKRFAAEGVHEKYQLAALSGTSGGAMCAALLWYGLLRATQGSQDPVFQPLVDYWRDIQPQSTWERQFNETAARYVRMSDKGVMPALTPNPYGDERFRQLWLSLCPRKEFLDLGLLVEKHLDFELAAKLYGPTSPKMYAGAVNIKSGRFKVFDSDRKEITAKALLASAAVPTIFEAVEVDGDLYWDGLYAGNPPIIYPIQRVLAEEVWIIQINPNEREDEPRTADAIVDRQNELAGNISMLQSVDFINIITRLLEEGAFKEKFLEAVPLNPLTVRIIRMDKNIASRLDYASKLDRATAHIEMLMQHGDERATEFWASLERDPESGFCAPVRLPLPERPNN